MYGDENGDNGLDYDFDLINNKEENFTIPASSSSSSSTILLASGFSSTRQLHGALNIHNFIIISVCHQHTM